ncbi:uncharacterized protein N7496_008119 [Penicillium cataractarum]|uniref:Transcription factor domain-containing protein n=1 Tax=Penicillium cataractarum TaxID=2100454 RepID=A0A9W9S0D2_9EURO|nr:uncharacterized protein N7496_008119 [Penicillium cataractarum]KAJ5368359.1 hypothetical protein N7496_008119 [Penicillium cataractarum]
MSQKDLLGLYFYTPMVQKRDQDYVSGLEGQIGLLKEEVRRLEALNARNAPRRSEHLDSTESTIEDDNLQHETQIGNYTSVSSLEGPSPIQDVSVLMWRMKLDDSGEKAFIGPSGNFCFPVTPKEPSTKDVPIHESNSLDQDEPIGSESPSQRDEAQITNYLLDLFQQHINSIHFFVDHDTLVSLRGDNLNPDLSLTKYSAIAAGSLLSDDNDSRTFGNDAASAVDSIILPACRQHPSVWLVQALAIMCWPMCAGMALHLGLPVCSLRILDDGKTEHDELSSSINRVRLTTAWSSLLIDRIATSLLGRNCLLPWKRVRAVTYLDAINTTPSLEEVAFDYHCRLWFIHDQHMDQIYSFEFDDLGELEKYRLLLNAREEFLAFHRGLDTRLRLGPGDTIPPVIVLHMSYNTSQMLIHRPYLMHPAQSKAFPLSVQAMSTAAAAMVRLIREYRKVAQLEKAPPFVVHSIMTAAVTHLLNATSSQSSIRRLSISQFRVSFDALITMQKRWEKARKSVSILQQLAQRWNILAALPLNGFPEIVASDNQTPIAPSCEELQHASPEETSEYPHLDNTFDGLSWADVDPANFLSYGTEVMDTGNPAGSDSWIESFWYNEDSN